MKNVKVVWVRGKGDFDVKKPNIVTVTGIRGAGKSALLETFAEHYLDFDCKILDLYGSVVGEGCAWLRSKWRKEKEILLLHGDSVEIVKAPCATKKASKLKVSDLNDFDIIISSSPLYYDDNDEYLQISEIIKGFNARLGWKKPVALIIREAANLYYSRVKIAKTQSQAKVALIYCIRQSRHFGFSLLTDTLRIKAIDLEIRGKSDFIIWKTVGVYGIPKEFGFMYSKFKPNMMQFMPKNKFVMLTQRGDICVGQSKCPPWHKIEGENILEEVGIEVVKHEPMLRGKGDGYQVGDKEHVEIMRLYAEVGLSYVKIKDRTGWSTNTSFGQVKRHNESVERDGYCPLCRRARSSFESRKIEKAMLKE